MIVASIETTLDTRQTNARSMASSKGWRLDEVTTPYVRIRVRVMRTNTRPLRRVQDGDAKVFVFAFFDPTVVSRKRFKLRRKLFGFPPKLHGSGWLRAPCIAWRVR
jgi:hypothetical protein